MKFLLIIVILFFAKSACANDSLLNTAKNFLLAKQKSFQQNATEKEIVAFLDFCADSVEYEHVLSSEKKFSFSGKELWKSGAVSHLGETRNVKLKIKQAIQKQNIVIVEYTLYREVKTEKGWTNQNNSIVSIMEFDTSGKIKKLTDYL